MSGTAAPHRPPFHLRVAVIIGCLVTLAGLAGIVLIPSVRHPFVRIDRLPQAGAGSEALDYELKALWRDKNGEAQEDIGKTTESHGVWEFYRAPVERPVSLVLTEILGENRTQRLVVEVTLELGRVTELAYP